MLLFTPQGAISEPNEKTVCHLDFELDTMVGGDLGMCPLENGIFFVRKEK